MDQTVTEPVYMDQEFQMLVNKIIQGFFGKSFNHQRRNK